MNEIFLYLYRIKTKPKTMNSAQINTEIKNTKSIMDRLFACIEAGQMEYYNDYISASAYYLKLKSNKPSHELSIA